MRRHQRRLLLILACVGLSACHHRSAPLPATPRLSAMAQIGAQLFQAPSLSLSGHQSCASCHDPAHAFAPADAASTALGGADGRQQGLRAVPNLTYVLSTPAFSVGPEDPHDDEGAKPVLLTHLPRSAAKQAGDLVPRGGFFWDGRADTLQGQALGPLLNPLEMGNTSLAMLVGKLKALGLPQALLPLAGPAVLRDDRLLVSEAMFAIARYETEDQRFAAFNSPYDLYLQHRGRLSASAQRGLADFEDPKIGNCAACHPDRRQADGRPPLFTDFEYEALAVPRNRDLRVNQDPAFYDLGLCGPIRHDAEAHQSSNCGLFKTPSLRNVARRHAFFHNGVYHSLQQVLRFYAERDRHPEDIYPRDAHGRVEIYDDLPVRYRGNIDRVDAPFQAASPGLSAQQQSDIIAFLGTLSDADTSSH